MENRGAGSTSAQAKSNAQNPVAQFKELVAAEVKAGREPSESPQVRLSAQSLIVEARTNRDIAEGINSISDKDVRRPLIEASKRQQELERPDRSPKAEAEKAGTITGQIVDPARRADAEKIVASLAKIAGVSRQNDTDKGRRGERDFEQGAV